MVQADQDWACQGKFALAKTGPDIARRSLALALPGPGFPGLPGPGLAWPEWASDMNGPVGRWSRLGPGRYLLLTDPGSHNGLPLPCPGWDLSGLL